MRRIAFALVLMIASGWAAPSQAQWWGGGWGRPCFGACRFWVDGWRGPRRFAVLGVEPRPSWGGPVAFGPPRFRAGGWGWAMWRREMRWRRFEAWRRWAKAGRDAAERPEAAGPRVQRPTWWRSPVPSDAVATLPRPPRAEAADPRPDERRGPGQADAVVAMFPTGALRFSRPRVHAAVPSRVLSAAAMLRRPPVPASKPTPLVAAVTRPPEPPARPAPAALRHAAPTASPPADVRPVVLRSQPAAPAPAPADPTPGASAPAEAAPADVPVAPLD